MPTNVAVSMIESQTTCIFIKFLNQWRHLGRGWGALPPRIQNWPKAPLQEREKWGESYENRKKQAKFWDFFSKWLKSDEKTG